MIKKRSNRVVGPLSKHVSEKQTSNDFPRRGVDKESRLFIEAEATEERATDKRGICVDDQSRVQGKKQWNETPRACQTSLTRCYPPFLAFSTVLFSRSDRLSLSLLTDRIIFFFSLLFPLLLVSSSTSEEPGAFSFSVPLLISLFAVVRSRSFRPRSQLHAPDHSSSISAANENERGKEETDTAGKTNVPVVRLMNVIKQNAHGKDSSFLFLPIRFVPIPFFPRLYFPSHSIVRFISFRFVWFSNVRSRNTGRQCGTFQDRITR